LFFGGLSPLSLLLKELCFPALGRSRPDLFGVELEALRDFVVLADGLNEEPGGTAKHPAVLLRLEPVERRQLLSDAILRVVGGELPGGAWGHSPLRERLDELGISRGIQVRAKPRRLDCPSVSHEPDEPLPGRDLLVPGVRREGREEALLLQLTDCR